ncbi:uncharacterized protein FA14DRAFT_176322 [Meira miltonrushii]|uniref:ALMS motif domain-containing protein n=1 Tax=Meira miltonrushii TaxID=1280837 RepID=A0A316VHL7_9BASI|nr:uncharacterized protein FA14DRAFT_176322 [Meira miltonrushii]PWN37020.1 hypothetical protein FA14DRAFT_176322 [Meira miltonrushii]
MLPLIFVLLSAFNLHLAISAGLDIDLNEAPKVDSDEDRTFFNSGHESIEKSFSTTSFHKQQPASILGKRVRKPQLNVNGSFKDQNKREKDSKRSRRYYQSLKDTRPEKLEENKNRRKKRISEMSPEEKQRTREGAVRRYKERTSKRGFSSPFNERLKQARRDVRAGIATQEQTDVVLQDRRNKLLQAVNFDLNYSPPPSPDNAIDAHEQAPIFNKDNKTELRHQRWGITGKPLSQNRQAVRMREFRKRKKAESPEEKLAREKEAAKGKERRDKYNINEEYVQNRREYQKELYKRLKEIRGYVQAVMIDLNRSPPPSPDQSIDMHETTPLLDKNDQAESQQQGWGKVGMRSRRRKRQNVDNIKPSQALHQISEVEIPEHLSESTKRRRRRLLRMTEEEKAAYYDYKRDYEKKKLTAQRKILKSANDVQRRRDRISEMTKEQREVYYGNKRVRERLQYGKRKALLGYGKRSSELEKTIRKKVKQNQATPDEIAKLEKKRIDDARRKKANGELKKKERSI